MLTQLSIHNFRSIVEADVSIDSVTFIVGANGSGKTNLVKAIELASNISKNGFEAAISSSGGRDSILPKAIEDGSHSTTLVTVAYDLAQRKPAHAPDTFDAVVSTKHNLRFGFDHTGDPYIESETLVFQGVLQAAPYINPKAQPNLEEFPELDESSVTISWGALEDLKIEFDPKPTQENYAHYMHWLGLGPLKIPVDSIETFELLVGALRRDANQTFRPKPQEETQNQSYRKSLISPQPPLLLGGILQLLVARESMSETLRLDLLLSQLRNSHPGDSSNQFDRHGANLSGALESIQKDSMSWNSIKSTMEAIFPNFVSAERQLTRTQHEFVQFTELGLSKPVESWESSDGTLRALAILVALESMKSEGLLIIEEPEQNLHPWASEALIEHIRNSAKRKGIQVIITTHSPSMIDQARPKEVIVTTRDECGVSSFRKLKEIAPLLNQASSTLGELWSSGALSGVPE